MGLPHRCTCHARLSSYCGICKITGMGEYMFPTRFVDGIGNPISDTTLNHLFKRLDFKVLNFHRMDAGH